MSDLGIELLSAAEANILGVAFVDADRKVQRKIGDMVSWLPEAGADCCHCTLLAGMEDEFTALAEGQRESIALPGVRGVLPGSDDPVTAIIAWNGERQHYIVSAMPDFTARQVETLIGSERNARRLIEQQLEAANTEVRFASFARTRLRLARDLHDTLAHSLMALLTQIRLVQHYASTDPTQLAAGLATAEETAISGLDRARDAIARLRMPEDLQSASDVEDILSDFAQQTGVEISVHIDERARKGLHSHSTTVQRVLHEALHNIETHAQAKHVAFRATQAQTDTGWALVAEIRDDGQGFDPSVSKPKHFGLTGMVEFAALAGGTCIIESEIGNGTSVRITLPAARPISQGYDGVGSRQ